MSGFLLVAELRSLLLTVDHAKRPRAVRYSCLVRAVLPVAVLARIALALAVFFGAQRVDAHASTMTAAELRLSHPSVGPGDENAWSTRLRATPSVALRLAQAARSISNVDRALFRVETDTAIGSAFQYRVPGYILTNRHVVDDVPVGGTVNLRSVRTAADGRAEVGELFQGTVRFKHADLDVAVIQIPIATSRVALQPVVFPGGRHAPRGIELFAHGFPSVSGGRGEPTISRGMLSAHHPDTRTGEIFYLTDTALSPGSSGGPVTDAAGHVIGIATAVSVVTNGAGNSWGYVLPIKTIDAAVGTSGGFASLPRPFDAARHLAAIRSATRADTALVAYRNGIEDAVRKSGSAPEWVAAFNGLIEALSAVEKPLAPERFGAFNNEVIRAATVVLARVIEFRLMNPSATELNELTNTLKGQVFSDWVEHVVSNVTESAPEAVRPALYTGVLEAHLASVGALLATAPASCKLAIEAVTAMQSETVKRRDNVKDIARALASLATTRKQLLTDDINSIDADAADLPLRVRQRLRTVKTGLQNAVDEWMTLPESCRSAADTVLGDTKANDGTPSEPPLSARADDAARGEAEATASDDEFTGYLGLWADAGFSRWGAVTHGVLVDGHKGYKIDLDEDSLMVWIGTRAAPGLSLGVRARSETGYLDAAGGAQQAEIVWRAFEVPTRGKLVVEVSSSSAPTAPFEIAVVYRESPLNVLRGGFSERLPGFKEVAHRSYVLGAGETEEFTFDARDWEAFFLHAIDISRHDIDLVLFDDTGKVVASDVDDDSYPTVGVESSRPVRYLLRLKNPTETLVFAETILFGRPRVASSPSGDGEPDVDWRTRTVTVTGSAQAREGGADPRAARLAAERDAKTDARRKVLAALQWLRLSNGRPLTDTVGRSVLEAAVRADIEFDTKHRPGGAVDIVSSFSLVSLDRMVAPLKIVAP